MTSDGETQLKAKAKKRRHIVVSETDSSDECDSPTVKTRRKQRINKLTNDMKKLVKDKNGHLEAGSSSQNDQTNKKIEHQVNGKIASADVDTELNRTEQPKVSEPTEPPSGSDNREPAPNSNNAEQTTLNGSQSSDRCPICLVVFTTQEVAVPTACNHCFCLQCIIRWSKNTNSCPVDRQVFNRIEVRENFGGNTTSYIPIETAYPTEASVQEDDNAEDDIADDDNAEDQYEYDLSDHPSEASYFDDIDEFWGGWSGESDYTSDGNINDGTFFFSTDEENVHDENSNSYQDNDDGDNDSETIHDNEDDDHRNSSGHETEGQSPVTDIDYVDSNRASSDENNYHSLVEDSVEHSSSLSALSSSASSRSSDRSYSQNDSQNSHSPSELYHYSSPSSCSSTSYRSSSYSS